MKKNLDTPEKKTTHVQENTNKIDSNFPIGKSAKKKKKSEAFKLLKKVNPEFYINSVKYLLK